ncbi:DUF1254 domain-containing protein [Halocynthiibacter sp. C4]|uniref:DUF1254 domain-containing protein n=1 Tax=Halocynthiibacter sp. C4 TaxID=2992758 RepID=UPI00237B8942|nr:DUF1254 domain-containing protein [Halocynthiibacter sp. C4]MDE0588304.1 DUF1254 domain-containing protein [Halocynthiibacter sp. C4]
MRIEIRRFCSTLTIVMLLAVGSATITATQLRADVPASISTPDQVETRLGTLEFKDGYPTKETAEAVRNELDYIHGVESFMNSIQGVSLYALRKGYEEQGIKDGDFLIFSKLMDSNSLFLTANADTVYFWGNVDLSDGPLVIETPPQVLGIFDDFWFRYVGDFGLAGPDKGEGGKFLLVGPEYDGVLPEGGFFVRHSRTNLVTLLFRAFLENDDPAPAVARVKETLKVYPYKPGGYGNSVGQYLAGEAPLASTPEAKSPRFVEGSGMVINTVPPNDFGHYELLNEMVQREPASALDPEIAGQFAAIGIVKGQEFAPDERMKKTLTEAVAFGNAASRTLGMGAHPVDRFRYYEDDENSAWWNMLFVGGYQFQDPPPMIGENGEVIPAEPTGNRKLHSRTSMFYTATGITPAMVMRLTGIGSQYLIANVDVAGEPFDGALTYKVTLPADIPAERFWSFTVYDNQSRSMLATPQMYPRAGSQGYPSPAASADADGSTTIYFSPEKPADVADGNWIQTDPEKGWFTILRLYSPKKSFFDKTWRPSEIELVE